MRAVFISYRREDVEGHAGRLFQDLAMHFGKDAIFMDVAGIEPGRDFRKVIDTQLASCGVLLALIGKTWLDSRNEAGHRRLDDPADFVRLETAAALKRDIPVIPVLVHGARMPRAADLPEDLRDLAFRNAVELTHVRWQSDVQVLIKALQPYVDAQSGAAVGAEVAAPKITRPEPKHGGNDATTRPSVSAVAAQSSGFPLRALLVVLVALAITAAGGYALYGKFAAGNAAETKVSVDKAAADKAAAEKAAAEKVAADKPAGDKAAAEKAAADKAAADRLAADKAAAAKAASDKLAADKAAAAKAASDKLAADKAAAAKATAAKAAADKAVADKAAADKVATDKALADKLASTKAAADKAAATDGIDSYQARAARAAAGTAAVEQAIHSAKFNSVNVISLDPPANSVLVNNQPVKVSFSYATTEAGGVRITVTPLVGLSPAAKSAARGPASVLPPGNSTGQETFTITSGNVTIDNINIRMIAQQGQVLYNVVVPARYEFRAASEGLTAAQAKMKLCNERAQNLTGDPRRRFMTDCLRQ